MRKDPVVAKLNIPPIQDLYEQVPREVWEKSPMPEDADAPLWARFCCSYLRMLSYAMSYFHSARGQPSIVINDFRHAGSVDEPLGGQWICEIYIYDSGAPKSSGMNYHGQSTSQLLFGCGICIENGKVTTHT